MQQPKYPSCQFSTTYTISDTQYQCKYYTDYKCTRNTNEQTYVARKYKYIDLDLLAKVRKIKLYNLLPVIDIDFEDNILVSQDFSEYSLRQTIDKLTMDEKYYIAAMLSITLQELVHRGVAFRNVNMSTVYLLDNHVCFQKQEFDYSQSTLEQDSFDNFTKLIIELLGEFHCTSFEEATSEYLKKCGVYFGPSENMPFADFIDMIFKIENLEDLADNNSNSYVYSFDTPEFFKQIPGIQEQIVLKSTKIIEDSEDYIIVSTQRELEIMENFKKYEPFVACFAYIRVQKQLFLFMERFPQDLEQAFQTSPIYSRNVTELCSQLSIAIHHLHRYQIIHRDLKPANLFLSDEDLDRGQIKIADFDRSRSTDNTQGLTGLSSTRKYDPPESGRCDYNYSSDIWQIGLIFFQIANGGIYPVEINTLVFNDDNYRNEFTKERIKQTLHSKDVSIEFIELIADCLNYNNKQRPTAQQLLMRIQQCFGDFEIDSEETMESTYNFGRVETMGQLSRKLVPWQHKKQIQSSNI